MRARLDDKVERLRSQTMNFQNDGFEVSLNIPDTADVKQAFSSVIDTVVEQEDEITGLNQTIEKMGEEHAAAQKKLVVWTAQSLQEMRRENATLKAKLTDAHNKIKNLSYNMQGYVDDNPSHDMPEEPDHIAEELGAIVAVQAMQGSQATLGKWDNHTKSYRIFYSTSLCVQVSVLQVDVINPNLLHTSLPGMHA